MAKFHAGNERIKRNYLTWLEDAKRKDTKTTTQVAAAIAQFEASTGYRDFKAFHFEQARKFKRDLEAAINETTGNPLSYATIRSRLNMVKAFFEWLTTQPGYKSKIDFSDIEYFNLSAKKDRIATAKTDPPIPTLDQIKHVITTAPHQTAIEKRDRALIAFAVVTGMRDAALASLPIGKVDVERRKVFQDARVVDTKNSKTMATFFFPVGEDIVEVVADWMKFLKTELLFCESDPVFPKTAVGLDENGQFAAMGLRPKYWSSASQIREIFKKRFTDAGLPYFNPHSIRHTLGHLSYELNLSLKEAKAWSQNLGHEKPMTTWTSYGKIDDSQTAEIMSNLAQTDTGETVEGYISREALEWIEKFVSSRKVR